MSLRIADWVTWGSWPYVLVCLPIVLLSWLCVGGAFFDVHTMRQSALRTEVGILRTAAQQWVSGLSALVEADEESPGTLQHLGELPSFQNYWSTAAADDKRVLYRAIVDLHGQVVMHSDPRHVGQQLSRDWYDRREPDIGEDVVRVQGSPFADDLSAYDVHVPVFISGRHVGELHTGLDERWLDHQVARKRREAVSHWVWFAALTLLVNAGAIGGLYYITRHDQQSAEGLAFQQQAQAQQLSILGAGLAHEVRNPLHALRINLHILRRVAERRATLPEDQLQATTRDSDTAVSRIELLLRDLLQFVEPTPGNVVEINLADEVRSAIDLLSNSLNRDQIEVDASNCTPSAVIAIDSARVRQIVLNLLEFAQTRAGRQSKLQVAVTIADSQAKLAISHPGPALTADQAEHLFEPFQSPVDVGTGLGMALVRAHVEAAGGNIRYEQPEPGQNRLVMSLPICRSA